MVHELTRRCVITPVDRMAYERERGRERVWCMRVCVCVCVCTHMHICDNETLIIIHCNLHTHTHTHTHTRTYTHIYICNDLYARTTGSSVCIDCEAGKFSAAVGATACENTTTTTTPTGRRLGEEERSFMFGDYDAGRIVKCRDPEMIIGTHTFELSMTIRRRPCAGEWQYCEPRSLSRSKLDIFQTMEVCMAALGTGATPDLTRSLLCSQALPLGQPSRLRITRK